MIHTFCFIFFFIMVYYRQCIKKQRHQFAIKGPYSQSYGFSGSHVWSWKLDHKEGWMPKNWCFQTVVLDKTLESPLDARRSNQSILKEINPEYSLEGRMLFEYTSLCYAVEPCCLSIPCIMICIFSHRLPIYPSPSPLPPWQPQVCTLCL